VSLICHCFHCGADDQDLWNQTLEAEDLQQIQSAVDKAETDVLQAPSVSTAQCGKKRRLDSNVRV